MSLTTKEADELIKKLMADVGLPNSQTLYDAFQKLRALVGPDPWPTHQLLNKPLSQLYEVLTEAQSRLAEHTRDAAGHIPENVQAINPSPENLRAVKHALRTARVLLKDHKQQQQSKDTPALTMHGGFSGAFVDVPPVWPTQEPRPAVTVFADVKLLQLEVATRAGMIVRAENLLGMMTAGNEPTVIRGELLIGAEVSDMYRIPEAEYSIHEDRVSHKAYNFRIQEGFFICDIQVINTRRGQTLQAMGATAVKWMPRATTAGLGTNFRMRLFAVDAVVI